MARVGARSEGDSVRFLKFRSALYDFTNDLPITFAEFLHVFEPLGDTSQRRDFYYAMYSRMQTVMRRNVREEVLQEIVPRRSLSAPRGPAASSPPAATPAPPTGPLAFADGVVAESMARRAAGAHEAAAADEAEAAQLAAEEAALRERIAEARARRRAAYAAVAAAVERSRALAEHKDAQEVLSHL
eukprot:m51a1_g3013 hypothetical protein (186) ;mRNA; f:853871-854551